MTLIADAFGALKDNCVCFNKSMCHGVTMVISRRFVRQNIVQVLHIVNSSLQYSRNMGMLHNLSDLIKAKRDKMTILVLGLNNSGKSTIINHFKKSSEQSAIMVPTVGFQIEQFYSKSPFYLLKYL